MYNLRMIFGRLQNPKKHANFATAKLKQSSMVKSQSALWDECLRLIQANVTEQQYKTWFAPIVFESYSEQEHTLMVQVPSPYVYEYLEQYYVGLLRKVLERVYGTSVVLRYRIVTVVGEKNRRDATQIVEGEMPAERDPTLFFCFSGTGTHTAPRRGRGLCRSLTSRSRRPWSRAACAP